MKIYDVDNETHSTAIDCPQQSPIHNASCVWGRYQRRIPKEVGLSNEDRDVRENNTNII